MSRTTAASAMAHAAAALHAADALVIAAGAGMGVDSGLPDFRGNDGFWRAYPPFARLGLSFMELANPRWFERDPALAWGFYGHRLNLYRTTQPHSGFATLRRWAQAKPGGAFVFTSNVDGQFQRAGFSSDRLVECHGSLSHLQCTGGCPELWETGDLAVTVSAETMRAEGPLPHCHHCGALARPNVLMFGDSAWVPDRTEEQEQRLTAWLLERRTQRLAIIELGAGQSVPTVRQFSEQLAARSGAPLIRINPREAEGPRGTISLAGGARDVLQRLDREGVVATET